MIKELSWNRSVTRGKADEHIWLSVCQLPLTCRAKFPELSSLFTFSSLKGIYTPALWVSKVCTLKEKTKKQACLSVNGSSHFLCCRASPLHHHLLNRLFSCFYIAVFYLFFFCSFYLMWLLFLCYAMSLLFTVHNLWSTKVTFFWLVKASVCLLQRGRAFVSVLSFLPAPLFHTHISTHTQQYHTASSYAFMLVFCKQ